MLFSDVLVQVSPPDEHGFCTLGTNVDCARAAVQNARLILGNSTLSPVISFSHLIDTQKALFTRNVCVNVSINFNIVFMITEIHAENRFRSYSLRLHFRHYWHNAKRYRVNRNLNRVET